MVGSTLSHYRIEAELGRGGMGVVYQAQDTKLGRTVALKFLAAHLLNDSTARERFVREARAAAMLRHDNICSVYEVQDTEDGGIFIVMPLYEGRSLKEVIDDGPVDIDTAVDYVKQTAAGLDAAASKKLVHRDIKPGNLLVTDDGRIKILDFGLARHADNVDLTESHGTVGTMAYMSPEQIQGEPVDSRSDLWSLGVVLYEMLTGRKPFEGSYEAAIIYGIVNQEIDLDVPEIPESLRPLLADLLKKNASDRIPTAKGVLERLSDAKTKRQVDVSRSDRPPGVSSTPGRRRLINVVIVAAALVGVFLVWNQIVSPKVSPENPTTAGVRTLAVMPFENASGDGTVQFLCDGIAENLINWLATIPDVKVVSKSAAFRERDNANNTELLAATLGIDGVIRGRLDHVDDQIVVSVSFVNADDDTQLWGERIIYPTDELLLLERSIVETIQSGLELSASVVSSGAQSAGETNSPEAYEHYLRGHFLIQSTNEESILEGLEELRMAINLDPQFARPYADIADALSQSISYGLDTYDSLLEEARGAAYTAVALAPELAEAHTALASVLQHFVFDWAGADAAYEEAIALSPQSTVPYHRFADYLGVTLRLERAQEMADRAIEIDALDGSAMHAAGWVPLIAGDFSKAAKALEEWNRFHPDSRWSYVKHALALAFEGMCSESLAQIEIAEKLLGDSPNVLIDSWMAWGNKLCNRTDRYNTSIRRIKDALDSDPSALDPGFAYMFALEGETENLVDFATRIVDSKHPVTGYLQIFLIDYFGWEVSASITTNQRFLDLLEQLDFPERD